MTGIMGERGASSLCNFHLLLGMDGWQLQASKHNRVKSVSVGVIVTIFRSVPGEYAQLVWRRVCHLHSIVLRTGSHRLLDSMAVNTGHC